MNKIYLIFNIILFVHHKRVYEYLQPFKQKYALRFMIK